MDALALASQGAAAGERELQESFRAAFLREDDERYLDTPWRLESIRAAFARTDEGDPLVPAAPSGGAATVVPAEALLACPRTPYFCGDLRDDAGGNAQSDSNAQPLENYDGLHDPDGTSLDQGIASGALGAASPSENYDAWHDPDGTSKGIASGSSDADPPIGELRPLARSRRHLLGPGHRQRLFGRSPALGELRRLALGEGLQAELQQRRLARRQKRRL